jgi:anti-sigma factor RsiW
MTFRFPHLAFEKIADLVEGRLADDEREQAAAHASECHRCAEQVARLERAIQMMRTDTAEDAPRYAIASVFNSFRSRVQPAPGLKRLLAALTFDSLQMAPATGLRDGAVAEQQLVYAAGENSLHLQVLPSGEQWRVTGQVLGECEGGEIEVRGGTLEDVKVSLTDQCEFMLPPLSEGTYSLLFRLPGAEVEIPDLKLGIIEDDA